MNFLPEIRLPRIEIDPLTLDPTNPEFAHTASYIPLLSNVGGAINTLTGTALLVVTVAYAAFFIAVLPIIIPVEIATGQPVFGYIPRAPIPSLSLLGAVAIASGAYMSFTFLARGILQSIPIAGNLALAFWDGRIRIIPN